MPVYEVVWLGDDGKERCTNVQADKIRDAIEAFEKHWVGTGCLQQIKQVKLL